METINSSNIFTEDQVQSTEYVPDKNDMLSNNLIIDNKNEIEKNRIIIENLNNYLNLATQEPHEGAKYELQDMLQALIEKKNAELEAMTHERPKKEGFTFEYKTFKDYDDHQTIFTSAESSVKTVVLLIDYICNPKILKKSLYLVETLPLTAANIKQDRDFKDVKKKIGALYQECYAQS